MVLSAHEHKTRFNQRMEKSWRELEKFIDDKLHGSSPDYAGRILIYPKTSNDRIINRAVSEYTKAGWDVKYHRARDQRDDDYLEFRYRDMGTVID